MNINFSGGWTFSERAFGELENAYEQYNDENPSNQAWNLADYIAKKTLASQVFVSTYFYPNNNTYIGISNRADDMFQRIVENNDPLISLTEDVSSEKFADDESMAFDLKRAVNHGESVPDLIARKEDRDERALNTFTAWCHRKQAQYKDWGFSPSELASNHTISNKDFLL